MTRSLRFGLVGTGHWAQITPALASADGSKTCWQSSISTPGKNGSWGAASRGVPAVPGSSHQAVVRDPIAERASGPGETGHGAIQDDSIHTGSGLPQVTLRAEVDRI